MSTIKVRMKHVRAARMCSSGARALFARHGLDWSAFLREGIPVEAMEATRDPMALRVAAAARQEAASDE